MDNFSFPRAKQFTQKFFDEFKSLGIEYLHFKMEKGRQVGIPFFVGSSYCETSYMYYASFTIRCNYSDYIDLDFLKSLIEKEYFRIYSEDIWLKLTMNYKKKLLSIYSEKM